MRCGHGGTARPTRAKTAARLSRIPAIGANSFAHRDGACRGRDRRPGRHPPAQCSRAQPVTWPKRRWRLIAGPLVICQAAPSAAETIPAKNAPAATAIRAYGSGHQRLQRHPARLPRLRHPVRLAQPGTATSQPSSRPCGSCSGNAPNRTICIPPALRSARLTPPARNRRSGRSPSGTPVVLRDDRWPRACARSAQLLVGVAGPGRDGSPDLGILCVREPGGRGSLVYVRGLTAAGPVSRGSPGGGWIGTGGAAWTSPWTRSGGSAPG